MNAPFKKHVSKITMLCIKEKDKRLLDRLEVHGLFIEVPTKVSHVLVEVQGVI